MLTNEQGGGRSSPFRDWLRRKNTYINKYTDRGTAIGLIAGAAVGALSFGFFEHQTHWAMHQADAFGKFIVLDSSIPNWKNNLSLDVIGMGATGAIVGGTGGALLGTFIGRRIGEAKYYGNN